MKAALIPPIPHLKRYGNGDFHLLLSHLLQNKKYARHYEEQRKAGAYLVLDNSAHEEGVGNDPEVLLFNALAIRAQEVVVPDVLDDGPATIERSTEALEMWFEGTSTINHRLIHDLSPALMYVPQGRNEQEWAECLKELVRMHLYISRRYEYRPSFVIGLSKDYEVWEGGLMHLVDEYLHPLTSKHWNQVHLLGWGRNLWELGRIAAKHPWIRSTDSAKPFVYARKFNLWKYIGDIPPAYPGRGKTYFGRYLDQKQQERAAENVEVFRMLAQGILNV